MMVQQASRGRLRTSCSTNGCVLDTTRWQDHICVHRSLPPLPISTIGPLYTFLAQTTLVEYSENDNRSRHQNAKVHAYGLNGSSDGKEAEDTDDDSEAHSKEVDKDAKNPRKMKWAPDELARLTGVVDGASWFDATSDSTVEKKTLGDDVGCVKAADTEGYDIVEGS